MADRLSSLDTSLLQVEEAVTPMHAGSVMVFDPPSGGFDYERLLDLISRRLALLPRYRQRIRSVPGNLGNPVWADDPTFDLTYHVRRSALPSPGSDEQLEELVARIQPRPLDRSRPLWEVYLVEGLARGRFAIITKVHYALADPTDAGDIATVILDENRRVHDAFSDEWHPRRPPSDIDLVLGAAIDAVKAPGAVVDTVRGGLTDLQRTAGAVFEAAGQVLGTLARAGARPAPPSPLNATVGRARRYVMVGTDLADHRTIRTRLAKGAYADDVAVNDVVLATITGAFRIWLLARGEPVHPGTTIRAMVPVSVAPEGDAIGHQVHPCFVNLPVGEPGPAMRLHQIAFAMRQQMEALTPVGAEALADLGGFAPPTMHLLGARLSGAISKRLHNVVITNVPGPREPRYAAAAKMVSTYPVMPLAREQALAIGLTSYDGGVFYGLNADRDALPDADVLGRGIVESLHELLDAPLRGARRRSR